jgi:hypothetical protein
MTELETWIKRATRHLSTQSIAQVRREIQDHYESAREAAIAEGATAEDAERTALKALGDARTANCQYLNVLLTSAEARLLGEGNWEARIICSGSWVKWLLLSAPVAVLGAAVSLYVNGASAKAPGLAQGLLALGSITGLLSAARLLPINTPSRGRLFRSVKWVVLVGALAIIFGQDAQKMSWLLISCLWPMFWVEWTRISIRRKLPVAQWPRHLYL